MPFTPKPFTRLKDEIYSEETSTSNTTKVILIIIVTALLGTAVMYLSNAYGEAHKEELINLRVMNQ